MKRQKKKCRFINLAEQLTQQNEIVSTTMDSMVKFVSDSDSVETRSDFEEIRKTVQQTNELNPAIDIRDNENTGMPRPKLVSRKPATHPLNKEH